MTLSPSRELPATESLILGLDEYIRARYGLLAVQTFEEERFLRFMRGVADHERHRAKGLYVWSRVRGLRKLTGPDVGAEPKPIPNREDALSLFEYIEEAEQGLYVLCDFAPYLLEYGAPRPELIRRLRELAWAIRSRPVTVIFLGARFPEIPELEKEVKLLDLPLPEEAETAQILDREIDRLEANPNAVVELDSDARANLMQALLGLTATEMENVLAKAAVRQRGFRPETARLVLDEKRALIRRTEALTFTPPIPVEHVGGYPSIQRLLRRAALTFTADARAFGVDEAKGLLLVGLPGCGKDTIKKAASALLGRALLDLDLGAVMGEGGGLIGSAELSIKRGCRSPPRPNAFSDSANTTRRWAECAHLHGPTAVPPAASLGRCSTGFPSRTRACSLSRQQTTCASWRPSKSARDASRRCLLTSQPRTIARRSSPFT
jgi:hypothetical protein